MAGAVSGGSAAAGGAAAGKIARVQKGDKGRTMMHTSVANEVIDAVNAHDGTIKALSKLSVSPSDAGEFKISEANAVLILKKTKAGTASGDLGNLTYPGIDGTYVLGVVVSAGVPSLQWFATDTCP